MGSHHIAACGLLSGSAVLSERLWLRAIIRTQQGETDSRAPPEWSKPGPQTPSADFRFAAVSGIPTAAGGRLSPAKRRPTAPPKSLAMVISRNQAHSGNSEKSATCQ